MDKRKDNLLKYILKEHLRTAEPVGSGLLVDKLSVSSATIRNEMAELEKDGYIFQPHTSAGRLPSEKAYKYYLDQFFKPKKIAKNTETELLNIGKHDDDLQKVKQVAKNLAQLSNETIYIAFGKNNFFYTGIANLFNQPEFCNLDLVHSLSDVIDCMDDIINKHFDKLQKNLQILVGKDNPFISNASTIVGPFEFKGQVGIMGLLGPMRMDYEANHALVNAVIGRVGEL